MPQYFFNIYNNGQLQKDAAGIDLSDDFAASKEAVSLLTRMAAELSALDGPTDIRIDAVTDRGRPVALPRLIFRP